MSTIQAYLAERGVSAHYLRLAYHEDGNAVTIIEEALPAMAEAVSKKSGYVARTCIPEKRAEARQQANQLIEQKLAFLVASDRVRVSDAITNYLSALASYIPPRRTT